VNCRLEAIVVDGMSSVSSWICRRSP
jgi:hypothetical protein